MPTKKVYVYTRQQTIDPFADSDKPEKLLFAVSLAATSTQLFKLFSAKRLSASEDDMPQDALRAYFVTEAKEENEVLDKVWKWEEHACGDRAEPPKLTASRQWESAPSFEDRLPEIKGEGGKGVIFVVEIDDQNFLKPPTTQHLDLQVVFFNKDKILNVEKACTFYKEKFHSLSLDAPVDLKQKYLKAAGLVASEKVSKDTKTAVEGVQTVIAVTKDKDDQAILNAFVAMCECYLGKKLEPKEKSASKDAGKKTISRFRILTPKAHKSSVIELGEILLEQLNNEKFDFGAIAEKLNAYRTTVVQEILASHQKVLGRTKEKDQFAAMVELMIAIIAASPARAAAIAIASGLHVAPASPVSAKSPLVTPTSTASQPSVADAAIGTAPYGSPVTSGGASDVQKVDSARTSLNNIGFGGFEHGSGNVPKLVN